MHPLAGVSMQRSGFEVHGYKQSAVCAANDFSASDDITAAALPCRLRLAYFAPLSLEAICFEACVRHSDFWTSISTACISRPKLSH